MRILGDFNAHVGNDSEISKGVSGHHGVADVNDNGMLLLQMCRGNALSIMRTSFQHRDLHKCTWCRCLLVQR